MLIFSFLLSFFFPKQVLDKARDLLKDVDLFDDFYKCEFIDFYHAIVNWGCALVNFHAIEMSSS